MAQAALRNVDDEIDTRIVRRLMARPLRVVVDAAPPAPEVEPGVEIMPAAEVIETATATEISRLKAQMMVMKAVLGAERQEADRLRACLTQMNDPAPLTAEAQAVRDRWAALVDTLLHPPR